MEKFPTILLVPVDFLAFLSFELPYYTSISARTRDDFTNTHLSVSYHNFSDDRKSRVCEVTVCFDQFR